MTDGRHATIDVGNPTADRLLPIVLHEFPGPGRLADVSARSELDHPRFEVDDRRAINGIEAGNTNLHTIDLEDSTDGDPQAIRTVFGSLSEDPHLWPLGVPSRMARHPRLVPRCLVEDIHHDAVTERCKSTDRPFIERRHELDSRSLTIPEVILGQRPGAPDDTDRIEVKPFGHPSDCNKPSQARLRSATKPSLASTN